MIRLLLSPETERRQAYLAFALMGVASLFCVQTLWYVPVVWLVMLANLQVVGFRSYLATLLGLATPYWFLLPYIVAEGLWDMPSQHFEGLTRVGRVADFSTVTPLMLIIILVVAVLSMVGMAYYYRHNRYDRLRSKMAFNGYAILFFFSLILFLLQPELYWLALAFIAVSGMPFVSRMVAWLL